MRRRGTYALRTLAVISALFIGACSDATPGTTTTAAAPSATLPTSTIDPAVAQYEADVQLIRDLWWGERLAFGAGFADGIEYWVANNYPPMGCTFDDYMSSRYPDGPVEGVAFERTANGPTIVPDDGWVIPGGRLRGQVADGRVYVMSVNTTRIDPRTPQSAPEARDLHVTIIDGDAHFFIGCTTS
jgi:hypothetical protein